MAAVIVTLTIRMVTMMRRWWLRQQQIEPLICLLKTMFFFFFSIENNLCCREHITVTNEDIRQLQNSDNASSSAQVCMYICVFVFVSCKSHFSPLKLPFISSITHLPKNSHNPPACHIS
jgi:hypothetical protein